METLSKDELEDLLIEIMMVNYDELSLNITEIVSNFTSDQLETAYNLTGSNSTENLTLLMESLSMDELKDLLVEIVMADFDWANDTMVVVEVAELVGNLTVTELQAAYTLSGTNTTDSLTVYLESLSFDELNEFLIATSDFD